MYYLAFGAHYVGVSQVMDCSVHAFGQCGNVECEVRELGSSVLGAAILSSCVFTCQFMER